MKEKISFSDLNWQLKTLVIFGWISFILSAIQLLIGLMLGTLLNL